MKKFSRGGPPDPRPRPSTTPKEGGWYATGTLSQSKTDAHDEDTSRTVNMLVPRRRQASPPKSQNKSNGRERSSFGALGKSVFGER